METYPYGRSGNAMCYYETTVTKDQLQKSGETGDNEVFFVDNLAFLYEAPQEDDTGRGHYSKWQQTVNNKYEKIDGVSGDDGMCYTRFKTNIQA